MPKYVIERELPNAGKLSSDQLRGVAQKSCDVLKKLGPQIQWVESYVTNDKVYCIISLRTRTCCASMRVRETFQPIRFQKLRGLSIQPRRNKPVARL